MSLKLNLRFVLPVSCRVSYWLMIMHRSQVSQAIYMVMEWQFRSQLIRHPIFINKGLSIHIFCFKIGLMLMLCSLLQMTLRAWVSLLICEHMYLTPLMLSCASYAKDRDKALGHALPVLEVSECLLLYATHLLMPALQFQICSFPLPSNTPTTTVPHDAPITTLPTAIPPMPTGALTRIRHPAPLSPIIWQHHQITNGVQKYYSTVVWLRQAQVPAWVGSGQQTCWMTVYWLQYPLT